MWRGGPTPFVAVLQVHLRAVGSTYCVSIAIEISISLLEVVTGFFARHRYHVEGVNAAALMLAHVCVPFYQATEEVRLIEVGVSQIEGSIIDNVATIVHIADEAGTIRRAPFRSDILSRWLTINGHIDFIEVGIHELLLLENEILQGRNGN